MKFCYLIGYPVGHSMSAVMHNAAFQELGLDFRYELHPVKPEELGRFVSSTMRTSDVRGASVTIPHKVSVVSHLDEVDAVAMSIGAVNTIVNDDGWLKGYNTDGIGAMRSLEEAFGDLHGAKVVILGAGGAARAISYYLSTVVGELVILNRTFERAEELADAIIEYSECRSTISALRLCSEGLGRALDGADVIINATSVGMKPNIDATPIDSKLLRSDLLVLDIVYNPPKTRLLREAEAAGARTLTGVGMLVYQGVAAFKLWTGMDAPEETMMRSVEEALGVV